MKKCLVLISLLLSNALVHAVDDVDTLSGLLRNACLAAKEFNQDDVKYQSYMTIAAAGFAMVPVVYALGKAVNEMRKTKVAVVEIRGMINDSTVKNCCAQFKAIKKDTHIKAVLLKIDSGGGYSASGDFIHNELKILAKEMPVIVLVEGVCASAAYHIAAAAQYIVAPEKSAVGSIGTYSQYLKYTGDAEHNRLGAFGMSAHAKTETFKAGKYKALHDPFKNFTDEERVYLQKSSDEHYTMFYENVAQDRNLSIDEKEQWADAQVFTGRTAMQKGLVDEIGTITNAEFAVKRLVEEHMGKRPGEIRYVSVAPFQQRARSFLSLFSSDSLAQFAHDLVDKFNQKQKGLQTADSLHTME